MNEAETRFNEIGFWNMPCVKISEAQQLEDLNRICICGSERGINKDCSYCQEFAEQHTLL